MLTDKWITAYIIMNYLKHLAARLPTIIDWFKKKEKRKRNTKIRSRGGVKS